MKDVPYTTSMQQGDNMVPPLFIYIKQVAMETLTKLDASRMKPDFRFFPNQKGRLTNQPTTESFEMTNVLFIDDMAIICETRKYIKELSQLILDHLKKVGLQKHTGTKQNTLLRISNRSKKAIQNSLRTHTIKQWRKQHTTYQFIQIPWINNKY